MTQARSAFFLAMLLPILLFALGRSPAVYAAPSDAPAASAPAIAAPSPATQTQDSDISASPAAVPVIAPGSASAVVQNFYALLQNVMKSGPDLGFKGRFAKLKPAVEQAYNLPVMTRLAVGPDWMNASPEQQQQLIAEFANFSAATYANRFSSYQGEQFEVLGEHPAPPAVTGVPDNGMIVETRLTPKDNAPVTLTYMLHKDDAGQWKITDVFVNGTISELAMRRSEFSTVVRNEGIEALMSLLAKKTSDLSS